MISLLLMDVVILVYFRLQLWDIAGQERYTWMTRVYYKVTQWDIAGQERYTWMTRVYYKVTQ